ncbi:BatD family protein [bacterium]|nr:BatD family protein [bacterium]
MKKLVMVPALVLLLLSFPFTAGASVSVTLKLDHSEATLADSIRMVVHIKGSRDGDSQPTIQGLESFHVSRGGTSSRVEIINGKVNAGVDYTYALQPKKTGTFKIGPVKVTIKGKAYKSNLATLKVVRPARIAGKDRGPVFLDAELSSSKVYVDEQTIYTLRLYGRTRISDISLALPKAEHLDFKQLGKPREYQRGYNGKSYRILEVRYALIPSKEGAYEIGPSRMNMKVYTGNRRSPRGLFDDPFFSFSTGEPHSVVSAPLEVTVLPLPAEGRPPDFTGLVGRFSLESKLDPSTIKAGDSATLTVILKGRGNVNRIPDLKMPQLTETKIYADQPVFEAATDTEGLAGSKIMKWALVPENEGVRQVPPLSLSFFDTRRRQYRTVKTSPHTLTVLPGEERRGQGSEAPAGANGQPSDGPAKTAVKELGRDILPVHTSMKDLVNGTPARTHGFFFWLVLLTPLLANMVAYSALRFRRKSDRALAAIKARKASKTFLNQYRQGALSANDLVSAIRDYLNDRFGLNLGSLTSEEAAEILEANGAGRETTEKLRAIFRRLENAIYTGNGYDAGVTEEDIPEMIKKIEKETR